MLNPVHLKAAAIAGLIFLAFAAVRVARAEAAPQSPTGLRLE